jgi:hypothetical protein
MNAAFKAYRDQLGQVIAQALEQPTYAQRWAQVETKMAAWSQRVTEHVQDLQWLRYTDQELEHFKEMDLER